MQSRLARFEGMTKQEEGKLLSLSDQQRKIVAENDRKMKNEFLTSAPVITHGAIKMHDKYKSFVAMAQKSQL